MASARPGKPNQTTHLDHTLGELKSALDEWSGISKTPQKAEGQPRNQTHTELLEKTRKLLKSLNQQLDELSD